MARQYIILYDQLIIKYKTIGAVFIIKVYGNMKFTKIDYI